ncbi:MAG TPA: transglycosylase domain-containing protein [Acidimicrobiales bacterium]|nr:transglycosylase domain-containing protein [Acidimicrobiales bacterium]
MTKLRVLLAVLAVFVLVAVVPPLRNAAAMVVSKVILAVASPWAPSIGNFDDLPQGTKVLAADGSVLAELNGTQRREPVKLDALPDHVPQAVLAAEDADFYEHGGVDPGAVVRAAIRTAQGRTQGGSTITQQLAKINYTNSERTGFRKLREVQYAVRLEKKYSKDELLERYLNQVYFGDGAYGIAAAADTFFGVPPEQLTPAQAATLAGKIKSPEGLDPHDSPQEVAARRDTVLKAMEEHGWLDDAGLEQALATPLAVMPERPTVDAVARAPHFVEYVKREAAGIEALGGSPEGRGSQLVNGGYTIETTLDPVAFDAATQAVQSNLAGPTDPATAVVTVKPGDGAITTLFGGLNFQRKFDVASQGRRQPGSAFKPFVYLASLRDGIDPRSTLESGGPIELEYRGERYPVDNYTEGKGGGPMTIDEAMVHSVNVIFAQLILEAGPPNVARTAESVGIPDVNEDPAIALGGLRKGATPLEMAAAYATFTAKGVYAEPYAITRIRNRHGDVVYTSEPKTKQVFDRKEVGVLNTALLQVVERGTATAARIGRPLAGKTGTTQNYHDAWFVGYVPQLSTAVWVGNPDKQEPMLDVHGQRVSGGSFPARIFAQYMRTAVAALPVEQIDTAPPESLSLKLLNEPPPPTLPTTTSSSSTTSSSTTSSSTTSTTVVAPPSTTTTTKKNTTTTSTSTSTTSTTVASQTSGGKGGSKSPP